MKIGKYIVLASITVLFFIFQNFTTPTKIDFQRSFINVEDTYINVEDFGAHGDDDIDDTLAIQKAIKYAFDTKAQRLVFQKKIYHLKSDFTINTIVLYGENLSIVGNGATFLKSSNKPGQYGEALSVGGLIPGAKFPDGVTFFVHNGEFRPARNIVISDIKIKHLKYSEKLKNQNCVGISHVDNLILKNVTCENAPQTSFAIVSHDNKTPDLPALKATRITLDGTHSIGSKKHAYRVISYLDHHKELSDQIELDVTIKNCTSSGVQEVDEKPFEIVGHKVNLWYRPAYNKGRLTVTNCKFDQSGKVVVSGAKVGSLKLSNNVINGGLFISKGSTKINIEKNKIQCAYSDGSPAIFLKGMQSESTFVNNQLFNYNRGCVQDSSIENFEHSPNQVMSRYFEMIHPSSERNDFNSKSY